MNNERRTPSLGRGDFFVTGSTGTSSSSSLIQPLLGFARGPPDSPPSSSRDGASRRAGAIPPAWNAPDERAVHNEPYARGDTIVQTSKRSGRTSKSRPDAARGRTRETTTTSGATVDRNVFPDYGVVGASSLGASFIDFFFSFTFKSYERFAIFFILHNNFIKIYSTRNASSQGF